VRLLYFAWVREKIGISEEVRARPVAVTNVGELLDWLEAQGPGYAAALAQRRLVRVAVDGEAVDCRHTISDDDEIAIFPPVTGGAS